MSVKELELILKKDPIITTWKAQSLIVSPIDVEKDYLIHARTHLPLGETSRYVDTIFNYVTGQNVSSFIGAILGDYGEGKTSFLVHIWSQSISKNILAVPPFEWTSFDQILNAISGWVQYVLIDSYPKLAAEVKKTFEEYRKKTIEELAKNQAQKSEGNYLEILKIFSEAVEDGSFKLAAVDAAKIIDFIEDISKIISPTKYKGILVLLDEPEVAAKELGNDTIQLFIFNMANELKRRKGNFGVFLAMPEKFYALASTKFAALPARLDACNCFPRLGDIYNINFSETLWNLYSSEFKLGELNEKIVSKLALSAIGQACSSDRKDLSYGPRSVISTFKRMVDKYIESNEQYQPTNFVDDIIDNEIMVKPEYRTRINNILNSQDVNENNDQAIKFLAAFPSGVKEEILRQTQFDEIVRPLLGPNSLIYKTAFSIGLRELRKIGIGEPDTDQLKEIIGEINNEFAPGKSTFNVALESFTNEIIPFYFKEKSGMQLDGWQMIEPIKQVSTGLWFGTIIGAFPEMSKLYPQRAAMLLISAIDNQSIKKIDVPKLNVNSGPKNYDFIFHFVIKWHNEQPTISTPISISVSKKSIYIKFFFDIENVEIENEYLSNIIGGEEFSLFWILYLFKKLIPINLSKEFEAEWSVLKEIIKKDVIKEVISDELNKELSNLILELTGENLSSTGLDLIDLACKTLLKDRYPDYVTLIKRPQWQPKIDTYINVLNNTMIPLAEKRGRQIWKATDNQATTVFGTSKMNLTGGAFSGFEDLIEIESNKQSGGIDVKFKVHTLEQQIREIILNSEILIKKNNIQCKYIPIQELLPELQENGYTIDELNKIIQIGKARNSFDETQQGVERGLFAKPLDIKELKEQLKLKLEELISLLLEYKKIPETKNPFDPNDLEDLVNKTKDEVDFDSTQNRINKSFELLSLSIKNQISSLDDGFDVNRSAIEKYSNQLLESREVSQLKTIEAKSTWRDSLDKFVLVAIKREIEEYKKNKNGLIDEINRYKNLYKFNQNHIIKDNLKMLNEGWSNLLELDNKKNDFGLVTRKILQYLNDFSNWIALLKKSDMVYDSIFALSANQNHKNKYKEYLEKFDVISTNISEHLKIYNITGLSSYRQFYGDFENLEKEANQYIQNLKSSFDQYKNRINSILEKLAVGERVKLIYNPLEVDNQYSSLRLEGINLIKRFIINQYRSEIETNNRELIYARDILGVISEDEASTYLDKLTNCSEYLDIFEAEISDAWFDELISSSDGKMMDQVVDNIKLIFSTIREVMLKTHEITKPVNGISSKELKEYLDKIPENSQIDFKELILFTMAMVKDPTKALSNSLDGIIELFKQNLIHIQIQKRRR